MTHYDRIASSLGYIAENFRNQPTLTELAAQAEMSESHFQRVFTQWAGVSPKKFLQVLTLDYARDCLDRSASVLDASYEAGLSGPSRLHDLFITIEAMTPGQYRQQGRHLIVEYGFGQTPFGEALLMWTERGVTSLDFVDDSNRDQLLERSQQRLPYAGYQRNESEAKKQLKALWSSVLIGGDRTDGAENEKTIKLCLSGTKFQLHVWQALLRIPEGTCISYGELARHIGHPGAARAVGTAVGANPLAFLIPCHRVIRENGFPGGYRWGMGRKFALLGMERLQFKHP